MAIFIDKTAILNNICYTELVYERINKKLNTRFSKPEIEKMIFDIINKTQEIFLRRTGKNIYVTNLDENIRITVNANNYRIITVDRIDKTDTPNKRVY